MTKTILHRGIVSPRCGVVAIAAILVVAGTMSGCGKCWNGGEIAAGIVGGILNPEPETDFDRQWDAHVEANERAPCRTR